MFQVQPSPRPVTSNLETFRQTTTVAEVIIERIVEAYSRDHAQKDGIYYWPDPLPTPSSPLAPDPLILFRPDKTTQRLVGENQDRYYVMPTTIREFLTQRAQEEIKPSMQIPLGLVDKPEQQKREILFVDLHGSAGPLTGGPLLLAGAQHSGKTTALQTLLLWLSAYFTPDYLRYAIIDPLHELDCFQEMPHARNEQGVPLWTDGSTDDKLIQFATLLQDMLQQRRTTFPGLRWTENTLAHLWENNTRVPQLLLVICHYQNFVERLQAITALRKLAHSFAEARTLGAYLVVTSGEVHFRTIPSDLMGKFSTKIGLLLNESQRLDLFGRPPIIPDPIPGRGLVLTPDRRTYQIQLALPIAGITENIRYEILKYELGKIARMQQQQTLSV
uniref:FtsK domain-containing protein n=1 Tax=Thermosporothrix sp. COM3 TaxID=2490863 RepID=A0A455SRB5_9CHLR|nr:hypothetical protein KTC_47090 [Thermosporothrix sp. COM3]